MNLISEVDKSGSDVEEYVQQLDKLLNKKMLMISNMRKKLMDFNAHLQMEKTLQQLYHRKQQEFENDEADDGLSNDENQHA